MSHKVLEHGSWYYTEKCPQCGCKFSFIPFDLSYEYSNIGELNETRIEFIHCPECYYEFSWPEFIHHSIEEIKIRR